MSARLLRIVSKCTTEDEFVSIFRRFGDGESIFIVTRSPKEVGHKARFAITLANGTPMLAGLGEVVEAHPTGHAEYGRPGMKLHFVELDDDSRPIAARLGGGGDGLPLPRHLRPQPRPVTIPPPGPALARGAGSLPAAGATTDDGLDDEETHVAASADASPAGQRLAGSDFILPANPFGSLTEESLAAFVECTLYEETGSVEVGDDDDVPPWWPPGASSAEHPATPSGGIVSEATPAPIAQLAAPHMVAHDEAQLSGQNLMAPATAAPAPFPAPPPFPPMGGFAGPPDSTDLVSRSAARSSMRMVVVAASIASLVSLLIGYLIWGGRDGSAVAGDPARVERAAQPVVGPPPQARPGVSVDGKSDAAREAADESSTTDEPSGPPVEVAAADDGDAADDATDEDGAADEPADEESAAIDAEEAVEDAADDDGADVGELPAGQCALEVVTRPDGAQIQLDGKALGVSPLETAAPCGVHELTIRRPRYREVSRKVSLEPASRRKLTIGLIRPRHTLRVVSAPSGATVKVNGKTVGRTPVAVPIPGFLVQRVEVLKDGYRPHRERVYSKSSRTSVRARLKKQ